MVLLKIYLFLRCRCLLPKYEFNIFKICCELLLNAPVWFSFTCRPVPYMIHLIYLILTIQIEFSRGLVLLVMEKFYSDVPELLYDDQVIIWEV